MLHIQSTQCFTTHWLAGGRRSLLQDSKSFNFTCSGDGQSLCQAGVTSISINLQGTFLNAALDKQVAVIPVVCKCCLPAASGSSYAKSSAGSTCFKDSTSTCQSNDNKKNSQNWGFYNFMAGSGSQTTVDLIAGAGNCIGGTKVGTATATCGAGGLTITTQMHKASEISSHHFYVGCKGPTDCTPPAFGPKSKKTKCVVDSSTSCGGNWPDTNIVSEDLNSGLVTRKLSVPMQCACKNAYWVVHHSASPFYSLQEKSACGLP